MIGAQYIRNNWFKFRIKATRVGLCNKKEYVLLSKRKPTLQIGVVSISLWFNLCYFTRHNFKDNSQFHVQVGMSCTQ